MAAALMAQKSLAANQPPSKALLFKQRDKENMTAGEADAAEAAAKEDDEDESDSNYMNKLRQMKPVMAENGEGGEEEESAAAAAVALSLINTHKAGQKLDEIQIGAKKRKRQFTAHQQFQVGLYLLSKKCKRSSI